ncbi:PREDICTED: NADH dehydrogenase [ubiquinone] 1 beta subcomplex subunit 9-like [Priapulus caudatus]|uniref:NADH dehydrogenase [ubiquinone] 1 beta subcomplex subunit 9 n=1 Tax=Priapulus caudatus TaxID=37621 RepID=A0ABM1EI03_PRICU|nr:PREDICTED: NADH dehydrogenase [ubiquinone] 1 beta subcomplex subunit 9-like [Priapulus caudatus]
MAHLQTSFLTHSQKVCRLYKAAARTLESYFIHRHYVRYQITLLRHRFEEKKDVEDLREAKKLLKLGEEELFMKQHPQPRKFALSDGGSAYMRTVVTPDYVLDWWHPDEKAVYPDYFAKREQRKKEYVEYYEKKYGKAPEVEHN